ncbi:MAG: alcohol dehydrogenase catalytic domain-containing protein [Verrucomicrobiota bacterium]|nr:alcohol dehydrogenase catalytic domain-containing protein [Verrucomicrobiota bacterium]
MKAAVLHGREQIRIEEVTPPALRPGEVRVRIEAALTCGTDLKVFKRGYHARMITPPAVFGHELAGVISELGPGVPDLGWSIGDRVVSANSAPCGACFFCNHRQENLCEDLVFLNGAYAETIVIPARLVQKNLLRLKPETDFRDAALTEPLACVAQGVEDAQLRPGEQVLVLGAGPIGLMFVALATHLGCQVAVAGRGEKRLRLARKLGAREVFEAAETAGPPAGKPSLERLHTSMLQPFDAVIEAVGKPETWEAAIRLVRKGGTVNFFGGCPSGTTITLDAGLMHYSSLTLLASFHHTPRTVRRALELIEAGVVRAMDFVDGECPLSRLPELFQSMAAGNHAVKTLINVHESND